MSLIDYGMIYDPITSDYTVGTVNKVDISIQRIKSFEPPEGYFLAFSGGKDSVVLRRLMDMAEVKYTPHYHITTVDPPELVRFINRNHADVVRDKPKLNMWDLIVQKQMPPMRLRRYCCSVLKEVNGAGCLVATGVRWAESNTRRKRQGVAVVHNRGIAKELIYNDDNNEARRMIEQCYRTKKSLLNPIVDWLDEDIWEFIHSESIPYCGLYDEGFSRLGCIGCPMAGKKRYKEFARWPYAKELYLQAFARMLEYRQEIGNAIGNASSNWHDAEEVFAWWMEEDKDQPYQIEGQGVLFDGI